MNSRKVPINYILLGAFTVLESIIVSVICIEYTELSILKSLLAATVVFGGLTLHAATTTRKYNSFAGGLCALTFSLLFLALSNFLFRSPLMSLLIEAALGLIAGIYVLIDTQLILRKDGIGKDDYVMGALLLYTDLVQLFIKILRLFG